MFQLIFNGGRTVTVGCMDVNDTDQQLQKPTANACRHGLLKRFYRFARGYLPDELTAIVNEDNNLGRQCVRRTAVARMFVRCTGDVSFNKRSADAGTLWPRQRTRADEIDKWLRCFLFQSNGAGEETLAGLHLYLLDTFDCVQDGLMCGCCSFT